jgi:hypothetical protein
MLSDTFSSPGYPGSQDSESKKKCGVNRGAIGNHIIGQDTSHK